METRDLLLLIGFYRGGKMFPSAVPYKSLPARRSLKIVHDAMIEQERALFGKPSKPSDKDDVRRRAAVTAWSGEVLPLGLRIEEVADPGVVLCLLYEGPVMDAPLPVDVFAQTLRRFALRDTGLRNKFDEHVERAGTFVPPWLSPDVRQRKSQDQFDRAMKVAREQGFAHAAPLFEGVRGDCFPSAQIAIAVYELRELGDQVSALRRLSEVLRVAPRNVAARMQRAKLLLKDSSRQVEAANDYLIALREIARPDAPEASRQIRDEAMEGLWTLHRAFANTKKLDAAVSLAKEDPERAFEALSRYIHTHPCAWDAQTHLATLALSLKRFDLTAKLLAQVRWLFPDDPNPHFVYGQALASKSHFDAACKALDYAAALAPNDEDIRKWLGFARKKLSNQANSSKTPGVNVADHVARSLLVLLGLVRDGNVYPMAMVLHKLPGDVSLALVLQAIAKQERKRFASAGSETEGDEVDLSGVSQRAVMTDYLGEALGAEQTVGDVADPGVIVVVLYEAAEGNDAGRPALLPAPQECRATLMLLAERDTEINAKLDRHLKSADASLKTRLEL